MWTNHIATLFLSNDKNQMIDRFCKYKTMFSFETNAKIFFCNLYLNYNILDIFWQMKIRIYGYCRKYALTQNIFNVISIKFHDLKIIVFSLFVHLIFSLIFQSHSFYLPISSIHLIPSLFIHLIFQYKYLSLFINLMISLLYQSNYIYTYIYIYIHRIYPSHSFSLFLFIHLIFSLYLS